jgi:hypothetical protein
MTVKWSHSALKDFEGCARRYHEVKVLKRYPFKDTAQTLYGKDVHKAIEDYGKASVALPAAFAQYKPVVDAVLAKPGRKYFEYEMGVTTDLKPCGFKDDNVWVRGIADFVSVDDENLTAWVVDWKTGNDRYPDTDQLLLMGLMLFAHFPHLRRVNSALMFIVKGSMVKHQLDRDGEAGAWQRYRERVAKIEAAHAHDVWNPKQSPLCGWCPVKTCEFNTKRD